MQDSHEFKEVVEGFIAFIEELNNSTEKLNFIHRPFMTFSEEKKASQRQKG